MTNGPRKPRPPAPPQRAEVSQRRKDVGAALGVLGAVMVLGLLLAFAWNVTVAAPAGTAASWFGILQWSVVPAIAVAFAIRLVRSARGHDGPSLWLLLGGSLVGVVGLMLVTVTIASGRA